MRNAVRYQYYVARQGQSTPVLTGVTPGLYIDAHLAAFNNATTVSKMIVRSCQYPGTQCTPDSDAGWGPWSQNVTGT
ncbi:MAG: hypothetical protein FJW39_16535 [Acidobacteria bacterium]|nr:hypothetical protein [Acidobacteriota bacterium]